MIRIMSGLLIPKVIDYSGSDASKFLADGRQPLRIGFRWPDRTLFLEWPLTSLRRRQCNDDQLATMVGCQSFGEPPSRRKSKDSIC